MRVRFDRLALLVLPAIALTVSSAGGEETVALGVKDKGVFPDLDAKLTVGLPSSLDREALSITIDEKHGLLLVWENGRPVKPYPLGGARKLKLGEAEVSLRDVDAGELAKIAKDARVTRLGPKDEPPGGDRDGDGLPDTLDIFLGGKKVALNAADYVSGYVKIAYPNGDVPRDTGVCTDVIVRAMRNAGIDLQKELHEDIARAPRSYPMVKRRDRNIDHRRVKTILPWFERHWKKLGTDPESKDDPFLPGDVVFFDTFPSKSGPDHIGIVSDQLGESGLPLIINNWTEGYQESEMDLLGFVPVTHRFRAE
jgi:hypothetical protein